MRKIERHLKELAGIAVIMLAWLVLNLFERNLLNQDIWLICEKRNEARDNGFHFFKYLRETHPDINAFYVITKDSADISKVKNLGNIIWANSFKHCLYYLAALNSISSQAYGAYPFNLNQRELGVVTKLCRSEQKTIFLQHGITKDELAHSAFDYDKTNIDYFVCSAQREYEFIKKRYGYPDGTIGCVGLCRFDNLYNSKDATDKIVLVMPTWRKWLKRKKDGIPLTKREVETFKNCDYYKKYEALLTDTALLDSFKKNGYKLYFYMHYQLQDYTELFKAFSNDTVIIADRFNYDVQDLLIRSKILITDYSSVYFDFAYMNKPIFYFQFDKERFESCHYAKGYFEEARDGFGPCLQDKQSLISKLILLLDEDAKQPSEYERRVNDFFNLRDANNCKRTYDAICAL